jgi:hypothetical protein
MMLGHIDVNKRDVAGNAGAIFLVFNRHNKYVDYNGGRIIPVCAAFM